MNIGIVTPSFPYPPDEGGKIVAFNHLTGISEKGHNVELFATVDKEIDPVPPEVQTHTRAVHQAVRAPEVEDYIRYYDQPFSVVTRTLQGLSEALVARQEKLDAVVLEHTHTAAYASDLDIPVLLSVHNIEYRSLVENARGLFPQPQFLPYILDSGRMFLFERKLFGNTNIDSIAFLSQTELDEAIETFNNKVASIGWHLPVGINVSKFEEEAPEQFWTDTAPRIVFTGTMRYPPNINAVMWLVKDIFPQIKSSLQDSKLYIVGKSPGRKIRNLEEKNGVVVTGKVESVAPYLRNADAAVVPIRQGTGIQLKLLEAIAAGTPVVSTSVGAEGTVFEDMRHILIRDHQEPFSKAVVRLLDNPYQALQMTNRAKDCLTTHYTWDVISEQLEQELYRISKHEYSSS